MEKTIICLAKKLAESEAENEELRNKITNLEQSQLAVDASYNEIMADFEHVSKELEKCYAQIRDLEKTRKTEQATADAKPKKVGNTSPRTPEQLEALKRGREKAAAKRAAAKRANGITPERPTAEELLRIAEGADF